MTPKRTLNPKEIIELLSKLKEQTPEYPADLLEAKKAAFLKHASTLNIPGKGQGGESGGETGSSGTGGSSAGLGGTAAQGFILQALIGFAIIAAMLLTAYSYREKISEILRGDEVETAGQVLGETLTAQAVGTPTPNATETPVLSPSPTPGLPTGTATGLESTILNGTPQSGSTGVNGTPDGTKTNPGLHLGQTPGTPAAPGHGNPGNVNQPDKPKPDKPKPDKPENDKPKDDKPK